MPQLIKELIRLIMNMSVSPEWKRLRIAMTQEELDEYRQFCLGNGQTEFYHSLKAIPIIIELNPTEPAITVEYSHAQPFQPPVQ